MLKIIQHVSTHEKENNVYLLVSYKEPISMFQHMSS